MLTYTDKQFVQEFRLNKSEIGNICDIVKEDMFLKGRHKIRRFECRTKSFDLFENSCVRKFSKLLKEFSQSFTANCK